MIFFIWLRYYINITEAVVLSVILSVIVLLILKIFSRAKTNVTNLKNKERQEAEAMFENLIKEKNYSFFYSLASTRHKNVRKKRIVTMLEKENGTILLYPFLKMRLLETDDLLSICSQAKKYKADKIIVLAKEYAGSVKSFASTLKVDILLLDQYETYQYLFKEYDFYPQYESVVKAGKKERLKEILDYSFARARAKGYIISAIILIVIAFLFRQSLYYSIVATLLLIFAFICIIRNPKQKKISKQIL